MTNSKSSTLHLDYLKKHGNKYNDLLLLNGSVSCLNKNTHSMSIPDDISKIACKGFSDCIQLKSAEIPENINIISKNSFSDCIKLENVTIPNQVTNLPENTFSNCVNLSNVNLSENLISIGDRCFHNCKSIQDINLNNKIETLGAYSFDKCSSLLNINLPDSIYSIGEGAFFKCSNLKRIKLPEGLDTLSMYLFGFCYNLTNVKIPDGVKYIKSLAFYGCSNLKHVILPKNLEFLGFDVFNKCTSLRLVNFPDSLMTISPGAFSNCVNLSRVTLPNRINTISSRLFLNCKKLRNISIPNSVRRIDSSAFSNCTTLKDIKLPKNLELIGSEAFQDCRMLKDVELPPKVRNIGMSAFYNCINLRSINLTNELITLHKMTFFNCISLKKIILPKSIEVIAEKCFSNCISLDKIIFSEGLYSINTSAFENCFNLTSLHFPSSLRIIGKQTFKNCHSLKDVFFKKGVKYIALDAFEDCKDITLHAEKDSYVHKYAIENNINFKEYKYIPVRKIEFKEDFLLLKKNTSKSLDLIFTPENATDKDNIIWESSDETVVSINNGVATTHDIGNTIITASVGEKSAKCIVSLEVPLEKISLNYQDINLSKGKSEKLFVKCFPNTHTSTSEPIWSSSDENIATVDSCGNIHAINKGKCSIICKLEDKTTICNVNVTIPLEDIVFNESSLDLQVDHVYKIGVSLIPENTTEDINLTYSSTDESIVSIDNFGNLKAIKDGSAVIMVSSNDKISTCIVNVKSSITHIKFLKNKMFLSINNIHKLQIFDNNNKLVENKDIIWSVSDSNVACIKDNAVIALSKGITVLVAQLDNLVATCILTVSLKKIRLFSVNYIKENSTTITGKGIEGATVKAFIDNKLISDTCIIGADKTFTLNVDKLKAESKVLVEIYKDEYEKKQEIVTVLHEFKEFKVDSIDSINSTSMSIVGRGLAGSHVRAYIKNTQIGKTSVVSSNGIFNIILPKVKSNTAITLKMRKSLYVTATINVVLTENE